MKNIAIKENHLYNKTFKRGKSYVGRSIAVYVLKDYAAERLARANPEKKQVNRFPCLKSSEALSFATESSA